MKWPKWSRRSLRLPKRIQRWKFGVETTSGSRNFLPRRCWKTKFPCTWKSRESKREFTLPRRMKSGHGKSCTRLWKARRPRSDRAGSGCSKLPCVMICPACNTEFPHGTVFCSRCHVTLVADLVEADTIVEKAYPGSALVQLWRGEDAALHASILEALAEANIPFYEQPLGSGPTARPNDAFLDHAHPRFWFEVAVRSSNLAEAEVILEKLLNEGPVDMELIADEAAAPAKPRPLSSSLAPPISAQCSPHNENLAGFLGAALKENGIPVRTERHGQKITVCAPL